MAAEAPAPKRKRTGPSGVSIEGLKEAQGALRRAGGSSDDQRRLNEEAVAKLIVPRAKVEVPVRSGDLKASIRSGPATTKFGYVLAGFAGTVPYSGVIHFGWATRGMGRGRSRKEVLKAFADSYDATANNEFGRKAVLKATRRTKQDKGPLIERNGQGRYTAGTHRSTQIVRNRLRGGPIKPNPFVYNAIDGNRDKVFEMFANAIEHRARIEELL